MASVLPLRSCVVLSGESLFVATQIVPGGPAKAAMAIVGAPLISKAIAGPLPVPTSIESEAKACCSLASPVKEVISSSILFLAKKPRSTPSSSTDIGKETCTALPTRILSAASAGPPHASSAPRPSAATRTFITSPPLWLHRQELPRQHLLVLGLLG